MAKASETLKYSLACSADDTFTEFEKNLGNEVGTKRKSKRGTTSKVMIITAITIQLPSTLASAGQYIDLQLTSHSESAMVDISDKDCFWRKKIELMGVGAAAGFALKDYTPRFIINKPYIKETIWYGIKHSLGATTAVGFEITFRYAYLSDWQLQRMITRRQ